MLTKEIVKVWGNHSNDADIWCTQTYDALNIGGLFHCYQLHNKSHSCLFKPSNICYKSDFNIRIVWLFFCCCHVCLKSLVLPNTVLMINGIFLFNRRNYTKFLVLIYTGRKDLYKGQFLFLTSIIILKAHNTLIISPYLQVGFFPHKYLLKQTQGFFVHWFITVNDIPCIFIVEKNISSRQILVSLRV